MTSKGAEGCAFVAGYNLEHKHSQNASDASRPTRSHCPTMAHK